MLSGFIKRLLMARQAQFVEGDVKIFAMPFLLSPVDHHVVLYGKLKGACKNPELVLFETGKDTAKIMVSYFKKKFSMGKGTELVNLWKNIFDSSGYGELQIIALKAGEGKAIFQIKNSAFAKQYLAANGRPGKPIDHHIAGLLAGFMSEMTGKDVKCEETKCIASGGPYCEFVISP